MNINSLRNKFEMVKEVIRNKIDILLIPETKLDDAFLLSQFNLEGFIYLFIYFYFIYKNWQSSFKNIQLNIAQLFYIAMQIRICIC